MPYKNPDDKAAWQRANKARTREYKRRHAEKYAAMCACGCGQRVRSVGAEYMAGHVPPSRFGGRPRGTWGVDKSPKARTSPSVNDLAWAAGFMEGEASFSTPAGASVIVAEQKSREPLDRLVWMFGGRISRRKRGEYQWRVSGPRARGIMLTVYVWLSERRRAQVDRAFSGDARP